MSAQRIIIIVMAIGVALLAVVAIGQNNKAATNSAAASAAPIPIVRVVVAKAMEKGSALQLPARTEPIESAAVHARATGIVLERRADLGDRVSKGQILAVISAPEIDSGLGQAQAELRVAKVDTSLALANRKRAEALIDRGAISREFLSTRVAEHERAVAAQAAAGENLERWQRVQSFQTVRAPFTGIVTARYIERGDRVVGDQSGVTQPMFELERVEQLRALIDVPPAAAMQVTVGQSVSLRFAELPDRPFEARVARSAGVIDSRRGTMRVELVLDNPEPRVPAGLIGKASFDLPVSANASLVPTNAVSLRAGQATIATLAEGETLRFVPVSVGRNLGQQIEVLAGLQPGARVVLAPNALLKEGDRVQVAPSP